MSTQDFAGRLREHREQAGLTREELADKCGFRPTAVRMWEQGACVPPQGAVRTIVEALNLNQEDEDALINSGPGPLQRTNRRQVGDIYVEASQTITSITGGSARNVVFEGAQGRRVLVQYPPAAEHFTGREEELAALLQALKPGRKVTLHGSGGIGKTALAAEAVHALAPADEPPASFPDGVIVHSFYGRPEATLALERLAKAFGEDPTSDPQGAARDALAGRHALLILDGTEEADRLNDVLDVVGHCAVIITSRSLGDVVQERVDVEALPLPQAIGLLRKWAGNYADAEAAARSICELVGRLPLAVRIAGRFLAHQRQDAADYLEWLKDTPLAALDQGDRRHQSVPVLLERSLEQVVPSAWLVLAVAGRLALAPFTRVAIAAALDSHENDVRRPLAELVNYGLLRSGGDNYELSHALIHTYTRKQLDPPSNGLEHLATHYASVVKEAWERGPAGYETLATARPHVLALLEPLKVVEAWRSILGLAEAIEKHLDIRGYSSDRLAVCKAGLTAAQALESRRDESVWLGELGEAHANLGLMDKAIELYRRGLHISREIGDRCGESAHLGRLGLAYTNPVFSRRAIEEYYKPALNIAREFGCGQEEADHLGNKGLAHADLGEYIEAINHHRGALAINREINRERENDRRRAIGSNLGNLGNAYSDLGQEDKAIDYYEQALAISREIGDRRNEGAWIGNLGRAYHTLGKYREAIKYHEQALSIHREIGNRLEEAKVLMSLAETHREVGGREEAAECLDQAAAIMTERDGA